MTSISITTVSTDVDFEHLAPRWDDLFCRAADANPFLSHDWLYGWWSSYRPAAALQILLAWEGEKLVGIAPMMLARERFHGLPLRVLRFVGDGTWETDHMNFLVDAAEAPAVVQALHEHLAGLGWDILELNQLPKASSITADLLRLSRAAWTVRVEEAACPFAILPEDAAEVLRRLPGRTRSSLRASMRRLAAEHTLTFGLHDSESGFDDALAALYRNHASRWQAKGQGGVFVNERKKALYQRIGRRFLARGWLRFFYLALDGKIVAQQFCFEFADRVLLLQEGFDFAFARENVGNVLRLKVFEHLAAQKGKTYDFLAGTSRHKAMWSTGTETDLRVRCVKGTLRGRIYLLAQALVNRLKAFRRQAEPERVAEQEPEPSV